jgi:hypothetical protein
MKLKVTFKYKLGESKRAEGQVRKHSEINQVVQKKLADLQQKKRKPRGSGQI